MTEHTIIVWNWFKGELKVWLPNSQEGLRDEILKWSGSREGNVYLDGNGWEVIISGKHYRRLKHKAKMLKIDLLWDNNLRFAKTEKIDSKERSPIEQGFDTANSEIVDPGGIR